MSTEQERADFETWAEKRGVWPRLTHEEIFSAGYQAGRAALQSQDADDPLQPAANWLIQAVESCTVADIQRGLNIGHNRAKRLFDHARRAEKERT